MVCLGLEPRAAGWNVHSNPLSYGGTPLGLLFITPSLHPSGFYGVASTH